MTNDVDFEVETDAVGPDKEWGIHNGVVVLAALGLVALSVLLEFGRDTEVFAKTPPRVSGSLSSLGFVLMLAAGSVIGMLVGTRMLQAHVGPRGAKKLAVWGIVALALSLLLQAGLVALNLAWQTQPQILPYLVMQAVSNFVTGTMAVGAAMVALAFVGRLRR